jgi:hypothetical protein
MADQRTRHLGGEQHRIFAGGQLPWRQACQRALRSTASNRGGRFQIRFGQCNAVPAVALHVLAATGDQCAADAVLGIALAADEAVGIGVYDQRFVTADRGAVGIADARVDVATGGLACQREVDRAVGIERPGVPGIEFTLRAVWKRRRHQFGFGEARGRIVLGELRDRAGLIDGRIEAVLTQVRRAGAALALPEIDGDADAAVARGLHRFHRAHAHVHAEASVLRTGHLGLGRATGAGAREQALRQLGERVQAPLAIVAGGYGGGIDDCVQWTILLPCSCLDWIARACAKRQDQAVFWS